MLYRRAAYMPSEPEALSSVQAGVWGLTDTASTIRFTCGSTAALLPGPYCVCAWWASGDWSKLLENVVHGDRLKRVKTERCDQRKEDGEQRQSPAIGDRSAMPSAAVLFCTMQHWVAHIRCLYCPLPGGACSKCAAGCGTRTSFASHTIGTRT
jgi:hypothetical protein